GGRREREITDTGKIMVLRRLFNANREQLNMYGKLVNRPGFLKDFNYLLTELKQNQIDPQDIEEQQKQHPDDPIFTDKMSDIALIYREYENYMEDKYRDREDRLQLLTAKIAEANFLQDSEIWVDGFTGFTGQEYRIIGELLSRCFRINFALTLVKNKEHLFEPSLKTYRKLKEMARKNNIECREEILSVAPGQSEEIVHLEKNLYEYPGSCYRQQVNDITLFAGSSRYREVERAAVEIVSLVRDRGYRWRDIGVVCANLDDYMLDIKRVFSEHKIPFFLDEKREIINNPIIQSILTGLRILDNNFQYRDLFTFIKTGFSDLSSEEADELENFALRFGISGRIWLDNFNYETDSFDMEEINNIRQKLFVPLEEFFRVIDDTGTVQDYTLALYEFLKQLRLKEKIDTWIEELKEDGKYGAVNENTQIWNVVMEVLDQLVEILGELQVELGEYQQILRAGFSEYELGVIPPTLDQVLIGTLQRSRSHEIKALFVIGVNDGILPSSGREEGILTDEEKIVLRMAGMPLKTDSLYRIKEERFDIYSALSKPHDYLWLSYARADNEGNALRPSLLVSRIKAIFPQLEERGDVRGEDDYTYISGPESTFEHLIDRLRVYRKQGELEETWWQVVDWYCNNKGWQEKMQGLIEGLFYQNRVSDLSGEITANLFSLPLKTSISRLEKFTRCPFAHFVEYGLNPQPREVYDLDSMDIGIIFHRVLERYLQSLKKETVAIDYQDFATTRNRQLIKEAIRDITEDFEFDIFNSSYQYRYLKKRFEKMGIRTADVILEHLRRGLFRIGDMEINFSSSGELPPIRIEVGDKGELLLEGRIDRVDYLRKDGNLYFKVIDYKTGRAQFSLAEAYHGLQVQLIMYLEALLAAGEKFSANEIHPAGIFFFKIDDPLLNADNIGEDVEEEILSCYQLKGLAPANRELITALDSELKAGEKSSLIPVKFNKDGSISKNSATINERRLYDLIEYIKTHLSRLGQEIIGGKIDISPVKYGSYRVCEFCDYDTLCQFDSRFRANSYRELNRLKTEEVFERIERERGAGHAVDRRTEAGN
ncbi:MAG: helicase-exonuclease AddAB subunit AddB, partial [Halanaerobiales bacterium]